MQQVLRTKGRGDRVYTVFQLPDHQGSKSKSGGVPPNALGGNRVSGAPFFTLFSYSLDIEPLETRWRDDGIGSVFFASAETARAAILELRNAIAVEPDNDCPPMRIERIETVPVTKEAFISLLNDGVGAIVKTYAIIETIGGE